MGRACLPAVVAVCASLALCAGAAAAPPARALVPTGGIWQSIPHKAEREAPGARAKADIAPAPKLVSANAKARIAAKAAKPAPAPKARPQRHPVAAAAVSEPAPRTTAAARTKELERRLDVLSPGTKLGEAMSDPENPSWRRARPGRPAGERNSLSVPFDEKGQAGFVARGYHAQPDVQNPHGNTGATFGLRTRF